MHLFNTPLTYLPILALTVLYFVCAAVTTFDIRLIQAKRNGLLPASTPETPVWGGIFGYAMWALWLALFLLNWWYALLLFFVKFILKVSPVLEIAGAYTYALFIGNELPSAVMAAYSLQTSHQKLAGKALKKIERGEDMGQVGRSFRYDQLVSTLNSVKKGTASKDQRMAISKQLISEADISSDEKRDLLEQLQKVYNSSDND